LFEAPSVADVFGPVIGFAQAPGAPSSVPTASPAAGESNTVDSSGSRFARSRPVPTRAAVNVANLPEPPAGYENVPPPLAAPRRAPQIGNPAAEPDALEYARRSRPAPTRIAPKVADLPAPPAGYENVPPPLAAGAPSSRPARKLIPAGAADPSAPLPGHLSASPLAARVPASRPGPARVADLPVPPIGYGNVSPLAAGVPGSRPAPTRIAPKVADLPAPPAGYENVPPPLAAGAARATRQKYSVPSPGQVFGA
jgi:hypothetical protein